MSQTEKTNTVGSHLHVESKRAEPIETETRRMATRGCSVGEKGTCWSKSTSFQMSTFWGSNVQNRDYS